MFSDNGSSSSSGSGNSSGELGNEGSSHLAGEGGIEMEIIVDTREDPPEKVTESSLPVRVEYEWVAVDVKTQYSLFKWSWLLNSWLKCIRVFERGTSLDIVSLEQVNVVQCVCPMYMCHFSQLHM